MCAGGDHDGARPSPAAVISNWRTYDAPIPTKLRLTARNLWLRVIRRQTCCGHHGQPGC